MCCVCVRSPQSLTYVSSWGFTRLSPSCNSNYLEYISSPGCKYPIQARKSLTEKTPQSC
ncbi:hypothetical protein HMPREF9544_02676 [Escherichia coli MS 153-1]|nr:hypothetical protein HMPREF9531_03045 [Escherichia coli MS 45-1]EFU52248.1 hypothetical protein HMPREF9544_02676 [Escherichia coli MS 153-1]EGB77292.1 hypothetical protein HMPREF9532_02232 [Escherichia coli MS 57-2]